MAFRADDVLLAQLFELAHHGAAIGADVFGKRAEREGEGEAPAAVEIGLLVEKAQQLFADGPAGKHLDALAEVQGFAREQAEEICST